MIDFIQFHLSGSFGLHPKVHNSFAMDPRNKSEGPGFYKVKG